MHKRSVAGLQQIMDYIKDLAMSDSSGIIRPVETKKLGIRFRFGKSRFDEKPYAIQLIDISDFGISRLEEYSRLKIEVFGHKKRMSFESQVLKVGSRAIWISLPKAVIEAERRTRQRFQVGVENMVFYNSNSWVVDSEDVAAPPIFGLYKPLASWTPVADISYGGVCVETRFPSILSWVEANPFSESSEIVIPMIGPCEVSTELRWTKRIRERLHSDDKNSISIQKYRLGLEFINASSEFEAHLSEFIKRLQLYEAC